MNIISKHQARTLLQKANDTKLTQQEQHLLDSYLQTDEGQLYARLNQQLIEWQPEMENDQFDYQQLRQATQHIDREVQRQRRHRRNWRLGQTVMGITAVIALIIVSNAWLQTRNQIRLEPTLNQPVATATPPAGMDSVDLRSLNPYHNGRTVTRAEEKAGYPLHLPTWQVRETIFKAADYYPMSNSVELLSAQRTATGDWGAIWILGQAELTPDTTGEKLPIYFNPFTLSNFDIEPITQQEVIVDGITAVYTQEFWSISNGYYGYKTSSLSWETDGKRFFLTIMDENEYVDAPTMVEYLTNMRLEETSPAQ